MTAHRLRAFATPEELPVPVTPPTRRRRALRPFLVALAAAAASAPPARAAVLTDGNSTATVVARNGMTVWRVNGTADNVFLSNYYLRVGPAGNEFALQDLLGAPTEVLSGTNRVTFTYQNAALRAVVEYTLTGGPAGVFDSRVASSVTLTNLGTGPADIHLFQYSDFDLKFDQASQLDQLRFTSPSSVVQTRAGTDFQLSASVGPAPTHYQGTDNFLDFYFKFFVDQDGPTTLNDTPAVGPVFPNPPKDSAFAFQWDRTLAAGESFRVGADFRLAAVPEPASLTLAGLAAVGLVARAARRRR